ncbi:serine/threonine-protein kinase-like protein At5g23170 [Pyrus communis]|uniref:serine/threonine-protein kinase-like protein At5g23170 n=1 Tax=Pyrus communis TaxID=23211 RepID=UPI0035C00C03
MVGFDYDELVNATGSFSPTRLVGKGSHGMVYKAMLLNKMVALKKPLQHRDNHYKLENEICVLSSLPKNQHVISLLGTSQDHSNKNKLIVMEFMPNGSLHDLLHLAPTPPPWPKRVEIAIQVARAVQFLHEGKPTVIHRDIKSENILFDSDWHAKLADFGLAVLFDSPSQVSPPAAGTIGYLDPCYTTPSKLSTKNDVFSFGVVLLEIISCRKVIDISKSPASIVDWAVALIEEERIDEICDARIGLPMDMSNTIRHILYVAASCVSSNVDNRPTIGEIVTEMENCVIERVRLPIWISMLRNLVRRKKKDIAKKWQQEKCVTVLEQSDDGVLGDHVSSGKLLLWQVLADAGTE